MQHPAPMTLSTAKYAFAVVGLLLLLGSLLVYDHTASFARRAARAPGTVTALVRQVSTDYSKTNGSNGNRLTTSYSYAPVVRFQHGAQHIQFTDSVATNPPAYRVGETVQVLYLESDPYDARIASFVSLWALPTIFGGIGTIFLALGAGMIFRSRPAAP